MIALDGEDWYDVRHGRLIITPDGTAKKEGMAIWTTTRRFDFFSCNPMYNYCLN